MVLEHMEDYIQKKMKSDHQLTPCTKVNSRWIKDLNISCDTIKILEEKICWKIQIFQAAVLSPIISLRATGIKERINKWDFIKLKSFCTAKENISNIKRELTI